MKSAVIDINESLYGITEGKEWLALIEYLGSMKIQMATEFRMLIKNMLLREMFLFCKSKINRLEISEFPVSKPSAFSST